MYSPRRWPESFPLAAGPTTSRTTRIRLAGGPITNRVEKSEQRHATRNNGRTPNTQRGAAPVSGRMRPRLALAIIHLMPEVIFLDYPVLLSLIHLVLGVILGITVRHFLIPRNLPLCSTCLLHHRLRGIPRPQPQDNDYLHPHHTIHEAKLIRFFQERVVNRPLKNQKSTSFGSGDDNDDEQGEGQDPKTLAYNSVRIFKTALINLYSSQAARGAHTHPHPNGSALRAFIKIFHENKTPRKSIF